MWESGAVVNYNILIAVEVGIITANDRTLLKENGGTIELGRNGASQFLNDSTS